MKTMFLAIAAAIILTSPVLAQEQSPLFSRPSQSLRNLYNKLSGGRHKTGVDVRDYDCLPECDDAECILREPVQDCVVGKKRGFRYWVCDEYVTVAEVRYRWKTKWITKDIPADFQEPVANSDDSESGHNVEAWNADDCGDGKIHCKSPKSEPENARTKRIDCQPGKTTIRVCYKSCVTVPYTVYRQIKRPMAIKQPCDEQVEVPITRYEGRRCKQD